MRKAIVYILFLLGTSCMNYLIGQNFPGGVKPFASKDEVSKKLPFKGGIRAHFDDYIEIETDITIQDIVLTNISCKFSDDKLIAMVLNFKDTTDRQKIISMLNKKYTKTNCSSAEVKDCFKGKNMKIEVADEYIVYRAVVETEL